MNLSQELRGANTIAISGHIRPDGDCVGSCMAAALYLRKTMPQARVDVFLEEFGESLRSHIPGTETICHSFETDVASYDVFLVLDTGADRLGEAKPIFDAAKKTVNIDHHVTNTGSGTVNFIDPAASSTCELVCETLDRERLDREIAQALYVGMVTDTGVFKYSNTSPKTMRIAGELMGYGFDFSSLIDEVFYEKTYVQSQILGRALLESILFMDGRCIFSVIDKKTMEFYQASPGDMDGIVSQLFLTKGVCCAIFLYQLDPLTYKVSLRSDGTVDVAAVARFYGGGGHVRAAGFTASGTHHDIVNNLSESIEMQMEKNGN
ncbi:MAG: bifunctional oligoribonuclease/PAP phosphatase NrnA [Eubacteriales bacterium]|nr:bifunctional oligoribonuclease/PAP phosphatase NrnA [Eubacteriales bacterium]